MEGNFFCLGWNEGEVEHFVGIVEGVFVWDIYVVSDSGVVGWCCLQFVCEDLSCSFLVCDANVAVFSHEYAGDCDWCCSDVLDW